MILGMEIGLDYVSKPIFNACTKDAFCFSFLQGGLVFDKFIHLGQVFHHFLLADLVFAFDSLYPLRVIGGGGNEHHALLGFLQGRIAGVSDYSHAQACHKAQDQQFLCYP